MVRLPLVPMESTRNRAPSGNPPLSIPFNVTLLSAKFEPTMARLLPSARVAVIPLDILLFPEVAPSSLVTSALLMLAPVMVVVLSETATLLTLASTALPKSMPPYRCAPSASTEMNPLPGTFWPATPSPFTKVTLLIEAPGSRLMMPAFSVRPSSAPLVSVTVPSLARKPVPVTLSMAILTPLLTSMLPLSRIRLLREAYF